MLGKIALICLLSLIMSVLVGLFLIPFFKKINLNQRLSVYLREEHKSKKNTPTMGGLIFIIPTLLLMLLLMCLNYIKISSSLIICIFTFIAYALIGFIDDYLIVIKNSNKGLSERNKFILQLIISIVFFYIFLKSGNEPLLWIHTLNLKLDISFLYGLLILFVLVATSNAVNLTDGIDGLAASLSVVTFLTLGIITYNTSWLDGYEEISLLCFCISSSLIGFLIFNINPAKIFMGDTGSLSLGALMGCIAILIRREFLLILICMVFVIETFTCIIQRIYYKFTKKRIFLMTPIHHTFQKQGYSEIEIVKIFTLIGIFFGLVSIIIGVIL